MKNLEDSIKGMAVIIVIVMILVLLGFFIGKYTGKKEEKIIYIQKDSTYYEKIDSLNKLSDRIPLYYTDSARSEILKNYSKYR